MDQAVIDTDVLVDYMQALPAAEAELARYRDRCISIVTWMEVMVGARDEATKARTLAFLKGLRVLPITQGVAERAVYLRQRLRRLKLPDAVIWATALEEDCLLLTRNTKDFPPDGAGVRFPYRA